MGETLSARTLADTLPGSWRVAATNFPMWLSPERIAPRFDYEVVSSDPLVLADDVSYRQPDGVVKHLLGVDSWRDDHFIWRGKGRMRLLSSRWSPVGSSDDGSVIVIRFEKSFVTPGGVDVIVREGTEHPELRAMIAHSTEQFGLTPEDFASLSWLRPVLPA